MTDEERIERLENKLKEALSWWRATEKQLLQKCKETKTNQKTIERLKAENAELKSSLTHANEECLKWHERAQNLLKDSGGSISGYEKKISDLQAENADLRERLSKAVELPCKLGDTIYEVYDKCEGYNCPYNGYYGQWRCHYEGERRCEPFIKIRQFCYGDILYVNDTVFVSREAAEARLQEIKEENDD